MIYFYVFKVAIYKNDKFIDNKSYLVSYCNICKFINFIDNSDKVIVFIEPYNRYKIYSNFDKVNFS